MTLPTSNIQFLLQSFNSFFAAAPDVVVAVVAVAVAPVFAVDVAVVVVVAAVAAAAAVLTNGCWNFGL